jgi:hypothetical protein
MPNGPKKNVSTKATPTDFGGETAINVGGYGGY